MQKIFAGALEWLGANKDWVFSGAGVALLGWLVTVIAKRFRRLSPAERLAQLEIERRHRESVPMFHWGGGSTDHINRTCLFENRGGTLSHLSVQTAPLLDALINPTDRVLTMGRGFVRFVARNGRIVYPVEFEVRYTTGLGEVGTKRFRIEAANQEPTEIT